MLVLCTAGGDEWHTCHVRDDDYCFIHYAYNYDTNEVMVQRTKGSVFAPSVDLLIFTQETQLLYRELKSAFLSFNNTIKNIHYSTFLNST